MKIKVNLFKPTGKWYVGGIVEVVGVKPYERNWQEELYKQQKLIHSFDQFYVVTENVSDLDPFEQRIYFPKEK